MAKSDRGFASMSPQRQREIASMGGKAAHKKGTAHEWDSHSAAAAGSKGGKVSWRRRQDRLRELEQQVQPAPDSEK